MDTHKAPRPTGLRKITLSQLRAETARAAPFAPTTPGRVLAAFKRAAPALGVSRRVVDLIDTLMSHSRPQDWEGGPGPGPIVFPSDTELEDRLLVGPSQRKTLVRGALDAGLLRLRRSPNGKRYGHRDKQGRIIEAYGFDLAPLAERVPEFQRASAEWEARRDEGRRLRREITSTRNHILALVDLALAQELPGEEWVAAAAKADVLWRGREAHRDPLVLLPIAARLRALDIHLGEQIAAALAAVDAGEHGETAPIGPENRPHLTTASESMIAKATTKLPAKAGPKRPMAHEEASSDSLPIQPAVTRDARVEPTRESPTPASALYGFVVTPTFLMMAAPALRDWVRSARAGWGELYEAADHVRSALGISPHAWGQACVVLGRQEAVTALAAICVRQAEGKVKKSPGGLLRRMVELHGEGKLRLDKTCFGLADRLRKQHPQPARAGQP